MDLKGRRFGRLLVLKRSKDSITDSGYISPRWKCVCDCGNKKIIRQQKLLQGTTQSCGCIRKEKSKKRASKFNLVVDEKQYIFDRIKINEETGCWEWTGTCFSNGYARAGLSKRKGRKFSQRASRMAHEVFVGEIPPGLLMCHKCDNKKCVNPDHLFLGTTKDNMQDMVNKGRSLKGEKCPNSKLTEEIVKKIRRSKKSKEFLSEKYGVSVCTIRDAQNRRTWKHI